MITNAYLTHPQVKIDPAVPVPQWGLSDVGAARVRAALAKPWLGAFRRIVSSDETKAIEAAEIIAAACGLGVEVRHGLHENDRSATGFLPPEEFERMADQFFAQPDASVRGWERAADAQGRIVAGITAALAEAPGVPTLFVGHGGVGTLLKCHLGGRAIARAEDQGPGGGGRYYHFSAQPRALIHDWRALED
jgi:broad specificity phosphatase PhoE